jgi:protocatechuate 3,4-dioxygenase beta subunit
VRPPHIHFQVQSRVNRLVTQMFFPGEPLNEKDRLFLSLGKYAPAAVARLLPPDSNSEPGAIHLGWDIVLYER